MESSGNPDLLWPFLVYAGVTLSIVAGMILLSYFLGQRHQEKATGEPYESGILNTGTARVRFSAQFYIVAMFFVIFDLEVVFIVAWAVSLRELGWAGYSGMLLFIGILIAVFVYEWRIGALDFGPSGSKILKAYQKIRSGEKSVQADQVQSKNSDKAPINTEAV